MKKKKTKEKNNIRTWNCPIKKKSCWHLNITARYKCLIIVFRSPLHTRSRCFFQWLLCDCPFITCSRWWCKETGRMSKSMFKEYSWTVHYKRFVFIIYKEIQNGEVAKSYIYEEGLPIIYKEMRKYLVIYEEAVSQIWLCNRSILNFLIYEENLIFFFISVAGCHIHY
jgi:hypothetical protein